jgi:signal transduction histidine kinase
LTFTVAESVATSAHAQRALLAHELPMLLREAITNAIRHGRARTIDVRLGVDGGALVLSVRDDGVGLPAVQPGAADGHFGLLSMQERARRTGGRLALLSPPGGGAEVRLTIAEVS